MIAAGIAGAPVWGADVPARSSSSIHSLDTGNSRLTASSRRIMASSRPGAQPPNYSPQQLDSVVGRIALYPDPLLAQMLTAATFSSNIPDADAWAQAHTYLSPEDRARAIQDDGLPWDPSVLALLPFPTCNPTRRSA